MADMDFQFLRLDKPDVMRYLPKFLAEDEHFKRVQDALSTEHEIQRQEVIDIASQFFVDTATWGLTAWEKVYQTNPPTGASVELRRSLLRAKMLGSSTMTKANLELLINQFVSNHDAYIVEETAPGTFKIVVPSTIAYWDDFTNMLMEMVPAHLVVDFEYDKDKTNGAVYIGGAPQMHRKYTVAQVFERNMNATNYTGGITTHHKTFTVKLVSPVHDAATNAIAYSGTAPVIHKRYRI